MGKFLGITGMVLMVCLCHSASGSTWYVDASVSASGGGTTTETAFKTIQEGIDASSNGDTVTVSEGTYVENISFNGKNIVLRSTDPLDSTVVANTIIDGNGAGSVVTFANTESSSCVLSGFTIRNGSGAKGGGICGGSWSFRTHATIENNVITGNSVTGTGGGILYCDGTIRNNRVCGNTAEHGAGVSGCDGTVENNVIVHNSCTGWGGGLHICTGLVQNNIITANSAANGAGLQYCTDTVRNNVVVGNSASRGGGFHECGATIEGNLIVGNSASNDGGGVYYCEGVIRDNSIVQNWALRGGGFYLCDGTIKNCIVWGNTASTDAQISSSSTPTYSCIQDWGGGGEGNTSGNPQFKGSPFVTGSWSGDATFDAGTCQTTFQDTSASWQADSLVGLTINPDTGQTLQFFIVSNTATTIKVWGDASDFVEGSDEYEIYNYRLTADSACMDTGQNESWMSTAVDLDGNARILYGKSSLTVDMGAYESPESVPPVITLYGNNPMTHEVGTPFSEPGYTATDNVEGDITGRVQVTGSVNQNVIGVYTLHYNVSDSSGNPAEEKTRTVNVVDTTVPVITLMGQNPMNLTLGTPYVEPGYTATDNYDGTITASVVVTGTVDYNTVGTYILRYNVSDSNGNPAVEKTRTVNVVNDSPPVITLSGANPVTLEVGTPYVEPGYTAIDDRDGDITASVVVTGSVNHTIVGTYTLHYNVTDSGGNPAQEKTRVVNVVDTVAPVITLSGDNPVTLEVGTPYVEPGYTASDTYDGDITGNVVVTGTVNHAIPGSYILRYNVSDSSGNPAQEKTRTVNVVDSVAPVITLSGDNPVTLEVGTPYAEPGYSASDNYDGDISVAVVITGSVDHTFPGSYSLKYNVQDSSGNPAVEKTRVVNVVDTTPPVITLAGDISIRLEVGTAYAEPGYTATDNYDGNITADVVVTGSVDHTVVGSYVLRYNVSDSSGNPAVEKTRTVEIVDTVAPVITLQGDNPLTLECGTPYEDPGYTATDNYDGDITESVVIKGAVDHTFPGSYALKYTVEDSSGNPAPEKTRVVNVVDTTPPEITLLGDNPMTLSVGTPYSEPGYSATDNCDGDVTADVVVTGSVDHAVVGSYTLHYNVSDWFGNDAEEKIRIVNVVDTTAPVITLSGDNPMTLEVGTPYPEPGYSATDNYDGDISAQVDVTGTVDHTVLGGYTLRYNVSDSSGNPAEEKTRVVNVADTTAPLITLSGNNPMTLEVGTPYAEPGYSATDNYDGDISGQVDVTGTVDHTVLGSYILRYNVSDSSGNPAEEKTRVVNVVDITAPVITLSGDNPMTLEVGTQYAEPGYTAADSQDGDITAQVEVAGVIEHNILGSYALHYNVSDSSGNPAEEKIRTVNVVDTTPPVITMTGDDPLTLEVGTPYTEPGYAATDNYDGDITGDVEVTGTVDHTVLGSYTLCYNVSDSSGNPAEEKMRAVNVVDTTAPLITLSGDNPLTLEVGTPCTEPGYAATDNYDGDITGQVEVAGTVDHTLLGSYTLRYNVSDSSGNPAKEKTRTVSVVDTTAPMITLEGDDPLRLKVGTEYVEPGYIAVDNYDGDIAEQVIVTGLVDHTTVGAYTLTYNVSDSSGNPALEKTRTVNVVGTTFFEVMEIFEVAVGIVQLRWASEPGATYIVWSRAGLADGYTWKEEATVPSEGETTTWTDSEMPSPSKFYRIELKQ
jgi:hypothetical protein